MAGPVEGTVVLTRQGSIATITLSHPGRLNAVTAAMWEQLTAQFARLGADASVRAVIVRGAGENFSAGADISEFPRLRNGPDAVFHFHQRIIAPALRAIRDSPQPIVAGIQGLCVGGGLEIACCCDVRIAAAAARFGAPVRDLGFPMAPEELQAILAVAGRNVALELLLEGKILTAAEAIGKGLLTRIVADPEFEPELARTAASLAAGSTLAARLNKQTLRQLASEPLRFSDTELRRFYEAWADSDDHREGVAAFLEKRRPKFG